MSYVAAGSGSTIDGKISLEPSTRTFTFESSDFNEADTYTVTVTGTLDDSGFSAESTTFTVTFEDTCFTDTITYTSGVDATYTYDFDNAITITPVFTSDNDCPLGAYSLEFVDSLSADKSSLVTFVPQTGVVTIPADLAQSDGDQNYQLTITANAQYGSGTQDATSTITFIDPCDEVTVSDPVVNENSPITLYSFVETTYSSVTSLTYTDSDGDNWDCGPITYELQVDLNDGNGFVPSTLSFLTLDVSDPDALELIADLEEEEVQDDDYEFRIAATLGDSGTYGTYYSNEFHFNTASSCETTQVVNEASMANDLPVYIDESQTRTIPVY